MREFTLTFVANYGDGGKITLTFPVTALDAEVAAKLGREKLAKGFSSLPPFVLTDVVSN